MEDDKRLERIEAKLDDAADHLASIDVTLGVQSISLKDHIRRTALLEAELRPIRRHVNMIEGALKLLGLLAALGGLVELARMVIK